MCLKQNLVISIWEIYIVHYLMNMTIGKELPHFFSIHRNQVNLYLIEPGKDQKNWYSQNTLYLKSVLKNPLLHVWCKFLVYSLSQSMTANDFSSSYSVLQMRIEQWAYTRLKQFLKEHTLVWFISKLAVTTIKSFDCYSLIIDAKFKCFTYMLRWKCIKRKRILL